LLPHPPAEQALAHNVAAEGHLDSILCQHDDLDVERIAMGHDPRTHLVSYMFDLMNILIDKHDILPQWCRSRVLT
jgi:hypothetical protein